MPQLAYPGRLASLGLSQKAYPLKWPNDRLVFNCTDVAGKLLDSALVSPSEIISSHFYAFL